MEALEFFQEMGRKGGKIGGKARVFRLWSHRDGERLGHHPPGHPVGGDFVSAVSKKRAPASQRVRVKPADRCIAGAPAPGTQLA